MASNPVKFHIRPLLFSDQSFLWECLYFAIHVPVGAPPPDLAILKSPDLTKYAADWGRPNDHGFVAFDPDTLRDLGALWLRQFTSHSAGYGFVEEGIPELSMAVIPEFRGRGIGSGLLGYLLGLGTFPALSLSVSPQNSAVKLYERFGFKKVGEKGGSWTMLWKKP